MLRTILLGGIAILAGTAVVAKGAAKEDVQAALKKVSDSSGYSWKSTTEGGQGRGNGTNEGKTEKDGLTSLTLKFGENTMQVVFKGEKGAIKAGDGEWQSLSDAGADGQQGPGRFIAGMIRNFKAPAAQAESALDKAQDLKQSDDVYSANLTEEAVKELMPFGRRRNANGGNAGNGGGNANVPQISNAKGTIKVWVKDGAATKIQYNVKGTMSFNGNDRDIDRTTTIEFSDVGKTKVEVPAEAKAKLG